MLADHKDIKERNKQILIAYSLGNSQDMIAKELGFSQPAVYGVIKRNRK
jgi:predicted transcriptional regulator